jgi:L-rhamnose mutarotase
MMKKITGKIRLLPGKYQEYCYRHDHIWPEMKEFMRSAGISNYTIWFDGENLFEYLEVEDEEHLKQALASSSIKQRWDAYMSDIIVHDDTVMKLAFEFN